MLDFGMDLARMKVGSLRKGNDMENPVDVAGRISPELSGFISTRIDDAENESPPTLGEVRASLGSLLGEEEDEQERMHHFDVAPSMLDELDSLIGEFGESADASDFVGMTASEALSLLISVVLEEEEHAPTLQNVREAVSQGLVAKLVGEGRFEEDEEETIVSELQGLIDRFGRNAIAESFLR